MPPLLCMTVVLIRPFDCRGELKGEHCDGTAFKVEVYLHKISVPVK
jgi:hypothetical protein